MRFRGWDNSRSIELTLCSWPSAIESAVGIDNEMCAGHCIVKAPLFTVDTGAVIAFSEKMLFQEFIFIM